MVPVHTRLRIDVLRHAAERKKASNTVRIAALALPGLQVHDYGLPGPRFEPAAVLQPDTVLLFPEDPGGSTPAPPPPGQLRHLLVLDGTWAQTRRMLRRMPALASLPRLSVAAPEQAGPRLRRPHLEQGMATMEALLCVLEQVEGPQPVAPLWELYQLFVERGRALRGKGSPPPGVTIHCGPPRTQGSSMHDHVLDPEWTFLNHGSFGSTPRELLDLQQELRVELEAQPIQFLARELWGRLDANRQAVAAFLGADPAGLAFVRNATSGAASVLQGLVLGPGDEILTTDHRYRAVHHILGHVAGRTGARVVQAAIPFPIASPRQVVDAVAAAITPRTRVLVVDWIASATALVLPVQQLVELARDRGIPVLIDGAHAPGQVHVDLDALAPDWFTGNLHKWLCTPKGCAVLWVAEEHRASTHHAVPSLYYGEGLHREFDWTGTDDPTPWLCAAAAVRRHERLGGVALRRAHHELVLAARDRLCARVPFLDPCAPDEMLGAMCSFLLPWSLDHRDRIRAALDEARVAVLLEGWHDRLALRISAFASYNRITQYDRLAEVLGGL